MDLLLRTRVITMGEGLSSTNGKVKSLGLCNKKNKHIKKTLKENHYLSPSQLAYKPISLLFNSSILYRSTQVTLEELEFTCRSAERVLIGVLRGEWGFRESSSNSGFQIIRLARFGAEIAESSLINTSILHDILNTYKHISNVSFFLQIDDMVQLLLYL